MQNDRRDRVPDMHQHRCFFCSRTQRLPRELGLRELPHRKPAGRLTQRVFLVFMRDVPTSVHERRN